jgi:hypothetical protein
MQSFWQWFIGEAGAGWVIGFLVGLLIGGLYGWLKRDRPPKIAIQEIDSIRLLDIHPSQRDKLSVHYADDADNRQQIENLVQREFVIYNRGARDLLEPVKLRFDLFEPYTGGQTNPKKRYSGFWRLIFDDPAYRWEPICDHTHQASTGFQLELPYLNSYPVHTHHIRAYLISEKDVTLELSTRVGKGWSAYFVSLDVLEVLQDQMARLSGLGILGPGILLLILLLSSMFQNPIFQVYLDPTDANIETALQTFQNLYEAYKVYGISGGWNLDYWQIVYKPTEFLWIAYLFLIVFWIPFSRRKGIGAFIARKRLGIRPASEFKETPKKPTSIDRLRQTIKTWLE